MGAQCTKISNGKYTHSFQGFYMRNYSLHETQDDKNTFMLDYNRISPNI